MNRIETKCAICLGWFSASHPGLVCPECVADARVGRMVREMPRGRNLEKHGPKCYEVTYYDEDGDNASFGSFDTPKEALEKAGGK